MTDVYLIQRCADEAEQTNAGTKRVALHAGARGSSNTDAGSSNSAELAYRDSLPEEKVVEKNDCWHSQDLGELEEADGIVCQREVPEDEEA